MTVLQVSEQSWGDRYVFHCVGCNSTHMIDCRRDGQRPSWAFDGNMDSPTFSPSLFHPAIMCHLFIRAGQIQYLSDCRHHLAGQTVPMEEVDYYERARQRSSR
jgi:Family of unknown function (DUF6527)